MATPTGNAQTVVYVGDSRVARPTKVHVPRDYMAYPGKSETFIPNFLLKEWMVGSVVLVGFLVLVVMHPAPLGYPADPTNSAFIPMPDWYFLFLYQLLKYPYLSEQFVVLGTVLIPGLAFTALTLIPFLDRTPERRFTKRPVPTMMMLLSLAAIVYLTWVSWDHYQHELKAKNIIPEHIAREQEMHAKKQAGGGTGGDQPEPAPVKVAAIVDADDAAYKEVYMKATCVQCHGAQLKGNGPIPGLLGIGDKYNAEQIMDIIRNGIGGMGAQYDANISMGLTDQNLEDLAAWLAKQKATP
ncbi:MAG: c-type cytochrome [Paenibacillaceae bacterium]|jgi:menaquinol-cytochrome c reductase cytochrome b/c subunit|nr:c-type cytochrome [Paenibacillaceae bacterium]